MPLPYKFVAPNLAIGLCDKFNLSSCVLSIKRAGRQPNLVICIQPQVGDSDFFPFFPFNIEENRPFRVLEIPLIVMDTTLHSHKAMNLNPLRAARTLRRLIDMAERYQSHVSLLWHNTTFDPVDYPGWGKLYWRKIDYALRKKGWVTSLQKIYEEWVNLSY